MIYNLTNYTSANNLLELAIAADGLSGGVLFVIVLVLTLIISFVAMKNFPAKKAFVSSTFVTFILSVMLWVSGIISELTLIVFTVLFVLAVAAAIMLD